MPINTQYTPILPAANSFSDIVTYSYIGYHFNEVGVTFNNPGYLFNYLPVQNPDAKFTFITQPVTTYVDREQ